MRDLPVWVIALIILGAIALGLGLFWLNAWLLMWAWNVLAVWFHLPTIQWIHGAAVLILLGCLRGIRYASEKKEKS